MKLLLRQTSHGNKKLWKKSGNLEKSGKRASLYLGTFGNELPCPPKLILSPKKKFGTLYASKKSTSSLTFFVEILQRYYKLFLLVPLDMPGHVYQKWWS